MVADLFAKFTGNNAKRLSQQNEIQLMSVMFDPEAAIYPFPPKPLPLNLDEKQFYREKSNVC